MSSIARIRLGCSDRAPARRALLDGLGAIELGPGELGFSPGAIIELAAGEPGLNRLALAGSGAWPEQAFGATLTRAGEPPPIRDTALRLNHVCIAVVEMESAVRSFEGLGGRVIKGGDNREHQVRGVSLRFERGIDLELLSPLGPEGELARHLDRRGPGLHRLTFHSPDLAATAAHLETLGLPLVGVSFELESWREAYLSPRATCGALIQIAETPHAFREPVDSATVDEILAGGFDILGNRMRRRRR